MITGAVVGNHSAKLTILGYNRRFGFLLVLIVLKLFLPFPAMLLLLVLSFLASHPRSELDLIWSTGGISTDTKTGEKTDKKTGFKTDEKTGPNTGEKTGAKIRNVEAMTCNNQQSWRGKKKIYVIN